MADACTLYVPTSRKLRANHQVLLMTHLNKKQVGFVALAPFSSIGPCYMTSLCRRLQCGGATNLWVFCFRLSFRQSGLANTSHITGMDFPHGRDLSRSNTDLGLEASHYRLQRLNCHDYRDILCIEPRPFKTSQ
ncbi:hypothetical protein VNO77_34929 [Canavalia gladiata]|uniref:Uncharacterized protein n=1 Tax=Canavalia gladiata TaxID=3824 RepID=A0AAN9KH46_CANGL